MLADLPGADPERADFLRDVAGIDFGSALRESSRSSPRANPPIHLPNRVGARALTGGTHVRGCADSSAFCFPAPGGCAGRTGLPAGAAALARTLGARAGVAADAGELAVAARERAAAAEASAQAMRALAERGGGAAQSAAGAGGVPVMAPLGVPPAEPQDARPAPTLESRFVAAAFGGVASAPGLLAQTAASTNNSSVGAAAAGGRPVHGGDTAIDDKNSSERQAP